MPPIHYLPPLPATMKAVVTEGPGGPEQLNYKDVPVPKIGPKEVLVKVLAAGVNNTEINTRLGWYSAAVDSSTADVASAAVKEKHADGGWNKATPFPLIQGTDCCGEVVRTGQDIDRSLLGERVLIRPCEHPEGFGSPENIWMASDFNGAFAGFVKVRGSEVFPVHSSLSDAELASLPCAYGTSENMISRAGVKKGDRVLITGASGGIGTASLQLCRRRGAEVVAIAGRDKMARVQELGAATVIPRGESIRKTLGEKSVDVVIDNVGGKDFPELLKTLKAGGRYVTSGAIGGPKVSLDMRDLYLPDITMIGCTGWDEHVFPDLISYVERGEIRPVVEAIYPLHEIARAQEDFGKKTHVGKLVLIPPGAVQC